MMRRVFLFLPILFLLCGFLNRPSSKLRAHLEQVKNPMDEEVQKFREAVENINRNHKHGGKGKQEEMLWKKIPSEFRGIEEKCAKIKDSAAAAKALYDVALIYAELAFIEKIEGIKTLLQERAPESAEKLGIFKSTENFLIQGVNVEEQYLEAAAGLFECIYKGYRKVFGITEISKVPGKKIRVVLAVDPEEYKNHRLYFHPTPMWHCECRFEMPSPKYLTVAGGCRLISGFAHELGHMVAMWGKYREREDDFHAWGPYCGFMLGDYVYERLGRKAWPDYIPDFKRTDGMEFYKTTMGETSGCGDAGAVRRLFYEIGEKFGPQIYGKAFSWMEKSGRTRTINNVRYYWLQDLKDALDSVTKKKHSTWLEKAFTGMHIPGKS